MNKLSLIPKAIKEPRRAVAVLKRLARARAGYRLRNGRAFAPQTVYIDLSNRCNLRCKMCPHWGELGINKKFSSAQLTDELTTEEVKKVIDEVSSFKPVVTLAGGGETFLHPGVMEIGAFIKEKGLCCEIITNGVMLEQYADDLIDLGIDRIDVSVDGPPSIHDDIRGVNGCFEQLSSGVKKIINKRRELGKDKPLIYFFCTVSNLNCDSLEEVVSISEEHEITGLTFLHLRAVPQSVLGEYQKFVDSHFPFVSYESSYWEHFPREFLDLDVDKLSRTISKIRNKKRSLMVEFLPDFSTEQIHSHYRVNGALPQHYEARCLSPWSAVCIAANGDVTHCYDILAGNVRKNNLMNIWNNDISRNFRRALKNYGPMPVCHRCPSLYTWY